MSDVHKTLNLDNSLYKLKIENVFLIPYSTLDGLFHDTFTTLYDDYIDRPKLTEQKNPFE